MKPAYTALLVVALGGSPTLGQESKSLEQIPALRSLPDVTSQLQQQIDDNGGNLTLSAERYRITRPLLVDLAKHGAVRIQASVGSTLIMDGPGPALRFVGSHEGTASPRSFVPATWNERMPLIAGVEILGAHPEAEGIVLERTVAAVVSRVSVRWCRHGIHLVDRNRNVLISDCHLYENSGVGVFLDDVNLHQINISNCHVSYNREGGIVVRDGNVRNLQLCGCDIEGNMPADESPTKTANVLIDVSGSAGDATKSIAEIAITGCTIQHSANYSGDKGKTVAPGGANIRLAGKEVYPIDSVTITANVISDTTTNIDIQYAHDIVISSNTFFAPKPENLIVANSQRVVVNGNTFNPRQFTRPGTIRFTDCRDCVLSNSTVHQFATDQGAIVLERCSGFLLNGLQLSDCGSGIVLTDTLDSTIANCRVTRTSDDAADISIDGSNQKIRLTGNAFSGAASIDQAALDAGTSGRDAK